MSTTAGERGCFCIKVLATVTPGHTINDVHSLSLSLSLTHTHTYTQRKEKRAKEK
jgi:hypothetical protein